MNYTDVDADRVLSTKAQIATCVTSMAKTRDVFKNQIISSLDVCWKGQAKDSFTAQWGAFSTSFESFVRANEKLNDELEKAAKGYNKADEEARQLVNGLPK